MDLIPVPEGTLATWCKGIDLTTAQKRAIQERTGSRRGVPRDTQRKRRAAIERIRSAARAEVATLITDPLWTAGTALYWAEGAKSKSMLSMTNTDPRILRVFIDWVRTYHGPSPDFVLALHLHRDNDENSAKRYWRTELCLPSVRFYKTFIKPPGTGQRTNKHEAGVCRVRMRRSSDAWHRTMAWIDGMEAAFEAISTSATLPPGSLAQPGRATDS